MAGGGQLRFRCPDLAEPSAGLAWIHGQVGTLAIQLKPLIPVPAVIGAPLRVLRVVLQRVCVWPRQRVWPPQRLRRRGPVQ